MHRIIVWMLSVLISTSAFANEGNDVYFDPITQTEFSRSEITKYQESLRGKYLFTISIYNTDGALYKMVVEPTTLRKASCKQQLESRAIDFVYQGGNPINRHFFYADGDYVRFSCVKGDYVDAEALQQLSFLRIAFKVSWKEGGKMNPLVRKVPETASLWNTLTDEEMESGPEAFLIPEE